VASAKQAIMVPGKEGGMGACYSPWTCRGQGVGGVLVATHGSAIQNVTFLVLGGCMCVRAVLTE